VDTPDPHGYVRTTLRHRHVLWLQPHAVVHFAFLTIQTLPGPCSGAMCQPTPYVPGTDDAARGTHARECRPVKVVKYLSAVWQRDQGRKCASGHLPPQLQINHLFVTDPQSRGVEQLLYLGAQIFCSVISLMSRAETPASATAARAATPQTCILETETEGGGEGTGWLFRPSAMTLSTPGVCRMSKVCSEMKARWCCWWPDAGGVTRVMAATRACDLSTAGTHSPLPGEENC
jgi:hypothetical protein